MTPEALKAALLDLAEFGAVYVDGREDANEIKKAAPVKTEISRHKLGLKEGGRTIYVVREVKEK